MSRSEITQLSERPDNRTLLEVNDVSKHFHGVTALDGVNLSVNEGEIVGLIGPNGAGKSTLFNCIMGVYTVSSGDIYLEGDDITNLSTPERIQNGISRTFQLAKVFPGLTVRENLEVHQQHSDESLISTVYKDTDDDTKNRIDELIDFFDLHTIANDDSDDLSTGQKKLLNIACALLPDPNIILLDEPTAGVNPALIDNIIESIQALNERGRTIFVIEHNMDVVRKISDYLYVFDNAQNLIEGEPENVLGDPRVLEAYFGE